METLKLEIVTPDGQIFADDVKTVTLPGSEGEFGVLPRHASLVSLLNAGIIDIELINGDHELVAVDWGHAEIDEAKVTVLADGAIAIVGENESAIADAIGKAKKLIKSIGDSDFAIAIAEAKIDSIIKQRKY